MLRSRAVKAPEDYVSRLARALKKAPRALKDTDDDKSNDDKPSKMTDDEANRPSGTDDGGSLKVTVFPSKAPTLSPQLLVALPSEGEPWYSSDAFIISAVLVGVFLLVGGALKFWWMTTTNKSRDVDDAVTGLPSKGGRFDAEKGHLSHAAYEPYNAASESASLLGTGAGMNSSSNGSQSVLAPPALKKAVAPFSIGAETPKFSTDDLQATEEALLMRKFTVIMAAGVVISLHTTKGPKPVLLSLVGDEVRWQAVKTAQKRYKLNLRDVTYVTQGKTTSNFGRASCADDRLCFSLLTTKTTLDLEASSTLERDCLCKGFKVAVEKSKGVST